MHGLLHERVDVSSNVKELDTKTTEAQQSKFICSRNSDVFNVQWSHSDTV